MPDRRKATRFELTNPLPVFEHRSRLRLGTVEDISSGGFRIISEKPINQDDILTCQLQLPRKVLELEFLSLKTQCMWSRSVSPGRFESGHKFVEISKQDAAVVLHLMINYGDPRHGEKKILIVG